MRHIYTAVQVHQQYYSIGKAVNSVKWQEYTLKLTATSMTDGMAKDNIDVELINISLITRSWFP